MITFSVVAKAESGVGGKLLEVTCEYYTPIDVATILNLSPDMVYDLLREGLLPAIRLGSGRRQLWRIPITAFRAHLEVIRTGPGSDQEHTENAAVDAEAVIESV
jgi:excisionase family DNA binding protein